VGVDAIIRTATPPPPEFLPFLRQRLREDYGVERPSTTICPPECVGCYVCLDLPTIAPDGEMMTLDRYYGSGYERGDWPRLRGFIEWLQRHTEGEVLYGDDSTDHVIPATPDFLDRMQAHWDEYGNEPYVRARRAA
jgi:hypothetical protein